MMKRMIAKILLFALMLCIGVLPFLSAFAQSDVLATVLFTNDTKGFTDQLGYIARYKENTDNAILINCGNFTKGSAEASLSNAKYSSQLMHAAGYDLISLGTDDYAYGYRALKRYNEYAQCELLSGNVKYSSSDLFLENSIQSVGGVKIGFFSVADTKAADYIPTNRADGYHFEDEVTFAKAQVAALEGKCDVIICLASFFDEEKPFSPAAFIEEVDGIDVMICSNLLHGRQLEDSKLDRQYHEVFEDEKDSDILSAVVNETIGDTLVISATPMLLSLGRLDISKNFSLSCSFLPLQAYDADGKITDQTEGTFKAYGSSPSFDDARQKTMDELNQTLNSLVALNKTTIFGLHEQRDISLLEETPLGDLFADAITLAGDKFKSLNSEYEDYYVVSVVSGTSLTANIDSGDIDIKDVFASEGIAEDVYYYTTDAAMLYSLCEKAVADIKFDSSMNFIYQSSPLFLQISGFNILADPTAPVGSKIQRMYLKVGDDEIDLTPTDTKKFLLGVSESFAKGDTGYHALQKRKPVYIGDFLTNYVRTAIASNVSDEYYISPGTESRITFKRIEQLQRNGDAWATIGRDYEDYAAAEVYVDGIDNIDCSQVDENGEVRITMNTGAHGVTVNGEDIYVSTVSGIGLKKGSVTPIVDYKLYYKTLDEAYKIDEDAYDAQAVKGYFAYLGRAYVQTKLTEEDEVVKATQDILNVKDDFLQNPSAFIQNDNDEDAEDEEEDVYEYPSLDQFSYQGTFSSTVFENTPKTSYSVKKQAQSVGTSHDEAAAEDSGEGSLFIWMIALASLGTTGALCAGVLMIRDKKRSKQEHE